MEREDAFATATAMISNLPKNDSAVDFWDTPRVDRVVDRGKWRAAADRLEQIAKAVDPDLAYYFLSWASDAAVGVGDLARGYELSPIPPVGTRQSSRVDGRLDLKLALGIPVDARDITSLFGPEVTAFGKRNIDAIELHVQVQLDLLVASGQPIRLQAWTADAHRHPAGYSLFNGHPSYLTTSPPAGWHFSLSPTTQACCARMVREAENTWREECDLPRVGEGWVAETQLYYALKSALPHLEVVQHYRSDWLGRQHLDVGIPRLRVGLEYQGAQHDQPVAFFGGEDAFARTVERDRRKLVKCRRHGWRLIYVREGYCLASVIADAIGP
jgi:hypothetical protein